MLKSKSCEEPDKAYSQEEFGFVLIYLCFVRDVKSNINSFVVGVALISPSPYKLNSRDKLLHWANSSPLSMSGFFSWFRLCVSISNLSQHTSMPRPIAF
jgi:hypothetical protein